MRRRFKSGTRYPLTTAAGDTTRNRPSDEKFDMMKAKRVRFEDTEMDGVPVYASSRGRKAAQSPTSGSPKTSEYAYFRKLKNGAVHGNSRPLHKENEQSKGSKVNCLVRETAGASDMLNRRTKNLKFSVSGKREEPSDDNFFLSPRVSKYDEPDQIRNKEVTNRIAKRSSLPSENVTPVAKIPLSSPLNEASENSDKRCSGKGIFSAKRHRLRQWIAQTSFSDFQKLQTTGSDLVSSLMSRLLPKGDENNDSSKGHAENSYRSITLHESNNIDRGIQFFHKSDKDLPENIYGKTSEIVLPERDTIIYGFPFPIYDTKSPFHESNNMDKGLHFSHMWDKDLPKLCSGKSSEILLRERDTSISRFSIPGYGKENHAQDKLVDLDQHSMSRVLRNSLEQHDFPSYLPFERYRSSSSFHFKELNEFGSIIEHPREEPQRPLLEWDFKRGKDTLDSSIITHDTAENVYSRLDTWNVDQRQFADNASHTKGLCLSSSSSNYYLEFDSLPNYGSTSCLRQNSGPVFDDVKWAMAESRPLYLPVLTTPKCIALEEDINAGNMLYNSNIVFSHRDQHCLKNRVSDGWSLSAAEFYVGDPSSIYAHNGSSLLYPLSRQKEAHGDPFNPFAEGAFNHDFFSSNLHSSLGACINSPLLLNNDRSYQELYFDDDDDNELEYR